MSNSEKTKQAGSALRSRLQMVPKTVAYGLKGGQRNWSAVLDGQTVGSMLLDGGVVSAVRIDPKFRGMGLGKKMYGEVMRTQPKQTLTSDSTVSDAARGVWGSLKRNPSYKIEELAKPTKRETGSILTGNGSRKETIEFNTSKGPQFRGALPTAAARKVDMPFEPKVLANQAADIAQDYGPLAAAGGLAVATHKLNKRGKDADLQKAACARMLLELDAVLPTQALALLKLAELSPGAPLPPAPAITREEATNALTRLKGLDSQHMTSDQARRGAALGAVAAPVLSVAQKAIAGDPAFGRPAEAAMKAFRAIPAGGAGRLRALAKVPVMAARNLAGAAAVGAVGGGIMPTVKHEVEREAERGKLRAYIGQGGPSGGTTQ
jgi:hypothetical protein